MSDKKGQFRKAFDWCEERLPIVGFIDRFIGTKYLTPRNLNYFWNFGFLALLSLALMIISGLFLSMHYTAHVDHAFDSVERIMRDVNYGWLMRYFHANGASFFFIVVYVHVFRGLYYGSYKAPREVIWWVGLLILFAMMAAAFLGYVLPWGQMSFWAATVITNLFSALPWVGESITSLLWGGFSVDNPTLNRFYALHFLIPFVICALVALHFWALHIPGSGNPTGVEPAPGEKIPFHPYYTAKDTFTIGLFMLALLAVVFWAPNMLGHPLNYVKADPLVTPPHIVPEWYFLPYYAILRAVPDKLLGVLAMFGSIFILFILPWLDTSRVRSAMFRPVFRVFFWIFVADCVLLTWCGAQLAEGWPLLLSRIATFWYFVHLLVVLPVVGWLEKPTPIPDGIEKPTTASISSAHD